MKKNTSKFSAFSLVTHSFIFAGLLLLSFSLNAQSPSLEWATSMGGSSPDYGMSITADAQGYIYSTGYFAGTATFGNDTLTTAGGRNTKIYITKQDSSGKVIWAKSMGGNSSNQGRSIASDTRGNVYSTGSFRGKGNFDNITVTSKGQDDIYTLKQDSSGKVLWAKRMGGNSYDYGLSITTDKQGYIYSTGYFYGTADFGNITLTSKGSDDIYTMKQDSSGKVLWAKRMGSSGNDQGQSITTDEQGNIYSTGYFSGTATFGNNTLITRGSTDIYIIKQDSSGKVLWAKQIGGSNSDYGQSIKIDGQGNIYSTGYFFGRAYFGNDTLISKGDADIYIMKQDSSGKVLWAKGMGGSSTDKGKSIKTDAQGNIYSSGYFWGRAYFGNDTLISKGDVDIYIMKQDSSGKVLWVKRMGGNKEDKGYSITLDLQGDIYNTGYFDGTAYFDTDTLISKGNAEIFVQKILQPCWSYAQQAISNSPVCEGDSLKILVKKHFANGGNSYNWSGPNGFSDTTQNPIINNIKLIDSGKYSLIITNNYGCIDSISVNVQVNPLPILSIQSNSPVCKGDTLALFSSGGKSYNWAGPNGFSSSKQNPIIPNAEVSASGNYIVTAADSNGCSATDTLNVQINSTFVQILSPLGDTTINLGNSIKLLAQGTPSGGSYLWKPSNEIDCPTCSSTSGKPTEDITYIVKYEDPNGCVGYDSIRITVEDAVCSPSVPTAFSPNNDGFNDKLSVLGIQKCNIISFNFSIYNRYGQVVFQTKHLEEVWDGTMNNKELNPGVFAYYIILNFNDGSKKELKGNVTLVK